MKKLDKGDIFTIPIDINRNGFGQIINMSDKYEFIMIVFKGIWNNNDNPNVYEIAQKDILFMGYSLDGKLFHKHWEIIGNYTKNIKHIELPYFRIGLPPNDIYLLDHIGNYIRPCTLEEFENLIYQKTFAPIRYENALKAYYGLRDWEEKFEELKPEYLLKGRRFIESKLNL